MSGIYGNGIALTERVLDYLWGRQTVTLNNIANVDTPGYKQKYISFEDTFRQKLRAASDAKTGSAMREAIDSSNYLVYDRSDSARVDENNVNLDYEYTELARTALHYQYLIQSVNGDLTRYRTAIKGQ